MKKIYNTPELKDEMLIAQDVMAASEEIDVPDTDISDTDQVDNSYGEMSLFMYGNQ